MIPWTYQSSGSSSDSGQDSNFQYYQPNPSLILNSQTQCIATINSPNAYTSSMVLSGKFLFTGSSDNQICLWRRNLFSTELGHESSPVCNMGVPGKGVVKCLVVSTDKIFSAHQDHKIRVWRIDMDERENGKFTHLATLPKLSDRAMKFLVPKNHVEIRRHKKATWVHHVDSVSSLALSNDESLLYSVSWDKTIKIWRTHDFRCLESISKAHDDAINAVAISLDGYVYTGSADKRIKVWRKDSEEMKHYEVSILEGHNYGINALALSTDECQLYSGDSEGAIVVWQRVNDGDLVVAGALHGHSKSILCLAVANDLVCSGSADKTVKVWKPFEGLNSCLVTLEGHNGPVKCLAVANDQYQSSDSVSSCLIYSGGLDFEIKVWQVLVPNV
ncbi:hypothetical protein LIER_38003 [Lithospermum erythrorhizon]|uniref:Uncharacterized protein n=1 Tax=Lithospermum erythrorhizon TaxID=34254 RepID=A0AAV3PUR3_LITER